jgi:hypothetical protein
LSIHRINSPSNLRAVTTIGVRACAACSTVPRETLPHRSDPHMTDLGEAQHVFAYRNHRDRIVFSRCTTPAFSLSIEHEAGISTNRRIASLSPTTIRKNNARIGILLPQRPRVHNRFHLVLHPTTIGAPSLQHRDLRHVISLLNYHHHIGSPKLKTGIRVIHG